MSQRQVWAELSIPPAPMCLSVCLSPDPSKRDAKERQMLTCLQGSQQSCSVQQQAGVPPGLLPATTSAGPATSLPLLP